MILVDGNKIANNILNKIKPNTKKLGLAIVQVGNDKISNLFVKKKEEVAKKIGINFKLFKFSKDISSRKLRKSIKNIKNNKSIHGILVQLPLPDKINTQYILDAIPFSKDVDMLSSSSIGYFVTGKTKIIPPATAAILKILETYDIKVKSKTVVIIGFGRLIGRPIAHALLKEGATVIILHSLTKDIRSFTQMADILISGVGSPGLITDDMIKNNAVLVDAGLSIKKSKQKKVKTMRFKGDISCQKTLNIKLFVPAVGGIGPITVAMVMKNLLTLAKKQYEQD